MILTIIYSINNADKEQFCRWAGFLKTHFTNL